ncbi:TraR/DksA C4-type zinc finger protein [Mesorhizobium xinjiangense]|uniref:TraR/DksA C4-type zinc finger protein n=1 Tax=Mesorhizobium xinjiangense TaxID=2678685 RepID=UPI0012ED1133|nr:TraR/DksA C4-type zinc finger protein [Mesorhizobium xinjiangense]
MKLGKAAFELADLRAEQEREAGILAARSKLAGTGSIECVECGTPIDVARRIALPSASRCVDCARCEEHRNRLFGRAG